MNNPEPSLKLARFFLCYYLSLMRLLTISYAFRFVFFSGKVFTYWLGVEPFLYIADPEFLKQMSTGVVGKSWGKPRVFKDDREPMFGNGLVMIEGDEWAHHRHVLTPAFSPANLKVIKHTNKIYNDPKIRYHDHCLFINTITHVIRKYTQYYYLTNKEHNSSKKNEPKSKYQLPSFMLLLYI